MNLKQKVSIGPVIKDRVNEKNFSLKLRRGEISTPDIKIPFPLYYIEGSNLLFSTTSKDDQGNLGSVVQHSFGTSVSSSGTQDVLSEPTQSWGLYSLTWKSTEVEGQ